MLKLTTEATYAPSSVVEAKNSLSATDDCVSSLFSENLTMKTVQRFYTI